MARCSFLPPTRSANVLEKAWYWCKSSLLAEACVAALLRAMQWTTGGTGLKGVVVVLAHPRSGSTKLLADLHNSQAEEQACPFLVEGEILNHAVERYGNFEGCSTWRCQLHIQACVATAVLRHRIMSWWCSWLRRWCCKTTANKHAEEQHGPHVQREQQQEQTQQGQEQTQQQEQTLQQRQTQQFKQQQQQRRRRRQQQQLEQQQLKQQQQRQRSQEQRANEATLVHEEQGVSVVFKVFPEQLHHLKLALRDVLSCIPVVAVIVLYRRSLLDSYTSLQLAFSTNVWANVVSAGLGSAHDAQQQQSHHDAALPAARSREMDSSTQRPAYVAISEDDFDEWCGTLLEEMDQSVQDVPIERAIILCYEDTIARASHQQQHQQQHHLPRHRTQTICAPAPRMISGTVDNPYLAQLLAALRHMWPRECTANKRGRPPAALTAPTVPLDGSWWGRKTGEGVGPHIHVKRSHLQAVPILSSDVAGRDDGGRSGGSGGGGGGGDEHRDPAGRCEGACQPSGISANHPLRRRQLYIGEARDAPVLRASILNSG